MKLAGALKKLLTTSRSYFNLIVAKALKSLGVARSTADLVNQAIRLLYQKVSDERLKVARMRTLENTGEG